MDNRKNLKKIIAQLEIFTTGPKPPYQLSIESQVELKIILGRLYYMIKEGEEYSFYLWNIIKIINLPRLLTDPKLLKEISKEVLEGDITLCTQLSMIMKFNQK